MYCFILFHNYNHVKMEWVEYNLMNKLSCETGVNLSRPKLFINYYFIPQNDTLDSFNILPRGNSSKIFMNSCMYSEVSIFEIN